MSAPCYVMWYIADFVSTVEAACSESSFPTRVWLKYTTEEKTVMLIKFRSQCFISKHCRTAYNINRDKVTCLRQIKHHLKTENKAENAFAVITFQTQLERPER